MPELGSTGLSVSRLGLGLAALGRPAYINLGHAADLRYDYDVASMRRHAHAVLDAAWQAGVRYFDVARSYGRAEEFLGQWLRLRGIATDAVVVGSKWGYTYTAGWKVNAEIHEVKEHSLPVLQRQWPESQLHLGPYLRLYQVHSATLDSGLLQDVPLLMELARLKESGVVIGLSLSGPQQAATLLQAMEIQFDGERLFDTVQATWNLLEPSAGEALKAAHAQGLGVIVKEALANGRLTQRNAEPSFAAKLSLLEQEAARLRTTVDALALAAALAQPWASVVLSGAATVAHLQSNASSLAVTWDEEAANLLRGLAETPTVYWQTRGKLRWN